RLIDGERLVVLGADGRGPAQILEERARRGEHAAAAVGLEVFGGALVGELGVGELMRGAMEILKEVLAVNTERADLVVCGELGARVQIAIEDEEPRQIAERRDEVTVVESSV